MALDTLDLIRDKLAGESTITDEVVAARIVVEMMGEAEKKTDEPSIVIMRTDEIGNSDSPAPVQTVTNEYRVFAGPKTASNSERVATKADIILRAIVDFLVFDNPNMMALGSPQSAEILHSRYIGTGEFQKEDGTDYFFIPLFLEHEII